MQSSTPDSSPVHFPMYICVISICIATLLFSWSMDATGDARTSGWQRALSGVRCVHCSRSCLAFSPLSIARTGSRPLRVAPLSQQHICIVVVDVVVIAAAVCLCLIERTSLLIWRSSVSNGFICQVDAEAKQ